MPSQWTFRGKENVFPCVSRPLSQADTTIAPSWLLLSLQGGEGRKSPHLWDTQLLNPEEASKVERARHVLEDHTPAVAACTSSRTPPRKDGEGLEVTLGAEGWWLLAVGGQFPVGVWPMTVLYPCSYGCPHLYTHTGSINWTQWATKQANNKQNKIWHRERNLGRDGPEGAGKGG